MPAPPAYRRKYSSSDSLCEASGDDRPAGAIPRETAADIMDNVMYEPEQFPGLIFRMGEPKVVMLLFASGKLVCTGAKHEDMVREAVEKLHGILEDYDLIYYEE